MSPEAKRFFKLFPIYLGAMFFVWLNLLCGPVVTVALLASIVQYVVGS